MLETKKPFAAGLALALLAATGCYDFDSAFEDCVKAGRCQPTTCDDAGIDLPDDLFHDANCDGVDGMPGNALFVDPDAGQDSNPGTPAAPLKRLSVAMRMAATQGKALYLAQGTYDEADLKMEQPVSLHGGYSGVNGNWKRGAEYVTQIGGGTIGFTVNGLTDAGVVIEWVRIGSTASTTPGTPSIGLRVMDSSGVHLRHVQVEAGAGAEGRAGDSPSPNPQGGADGGVGKNGDAGTPTGGVQGASSCGPGSYAGGVGGQGAGDYGTPPAAGAPGQPSTTGGGDAGVNKINSGCGDAFCECVGVPGGEGQPGAPGSTGTHGQPGDGTGELVGGTWVAKSGTNGEDGTLGAGGGGGGGGGYCEAPGFAQSKGGGGGGGGAGGCPGAGAKGGQGGGASIAMLLVRGNVELEACTLKTGGGGKGGAGGRGGLGGMGGPGGAGGLGMFSEKTPPGYLYQATGGNGGKGGKGGDGGPGGHGGNGAGGPSVGVWCDPSSSLSQTGTTFGLKDPGAPGPGPLPEGNPGLLKNYNGCPGFP
ncbi:PE-PGRS family protein [Archangium gephyra]|uniref:PE-PGRS family protein n=1 Tax=Archangium gephyra TaxID=48 RepID=UPI0035D5254B